MISSFPPDILTKASIGEPVMLDSDPRFELREFHFFLGERLAAGDDLLSPEEALDQWRDVHPPSEACAQDIVAVQEALAEMAAGDTGLPLDEFDRQFRLRHGLPVNP
jgi:hypothetical protein